MRLLFLTQELPYPPIGGAAVRIASLIRALAAEHSIEILSFGRPEAPVPEELTKICARVEVLKSPLRQNRWGRLSAYMAGQLMATPWMVQEWRSAEMSARVAERSKEADAVVAELLGMSQYLAQVDEPLRIYDAHNLESSILEHVATFSKNPLRRLHAGREAQRVRRYERKMCQNSDLVVTVTGPDALGLVRLSSDALVRAVPIAIVVEDYPMLWSPGEPKLHFFGDMAWLPNVDAAVYLHSEVLPLLEKRGLQPELVLAGKRPAPRVQALAGPRVHVTGYVPSMEEALRGDTIVVVPLRAGSGMRVKILEAMAWGLPVVSTTLGCAGIDHGGALLEANGAAAIAAALEKLLRDEGLRARLSDTGRKRVAQLYGHRVAGRQFLDAIKEAYLV